MCVSLARVVHNLNVVISIYAHGAHRSQSVQGEYISLFTRPADAKRPSRSRDLAVGDQYSPLALDRSKIQVAAVTDVAVSETSIVAPRHTVAKDSAARGVGGEEIDEKSAQRCSSVRPA